MPKSLESINPVKGKEKNIDPNRKKKLTPIDSSNSYITKKSELLELPLDSLIDNPENGRKIYDGIELQKLADSIQDVGLNDPITVIEDGKTNSYMIVSGHRRKRALKIYNIKTAQCKVIEAKDALQISKIAYYANSARTDLTKIEQATELKAMKDNHNLSLSELSKIAGMSKAKLSKMLKLLELTEDIQSIIDVVQTFDDESSYCFSYSHATRLYAVDARQHSEIVDRCIKARWSQRQFITYLEKINSLDKEKPEPKQDTKLSELQKIWSSPKYNLEFVEVLKTDKDGYITLKFLESELTQRLKRY